MIGFDLNEEQLRFQKAARIFAEKEMKPYAAELDRRQGKDFDWEIVRRFAKANLMGLHIPQEYGGLGVDALTAAVVVEELGAACLGITEVVGGTWLATTCLMLVGNEDQKQRYLPQVCGENIKLAGLAVTEPEAGSDIAAIRTRATRKGDYYLLNGNKTF
ncbi:MAG: acyl-CoA dehydrogenase, partial [Desulfobacca sp.]|nr:acyl-CoA dehydrogenase [Desulfobacca sp.]